LSVSVSVNIPSTTVLGSSKLPCQLNMFKTWCSSH